MASKDHRPLHEIVAEDLIRRLEQGTAPWQKPWVDGKPDFQLPYNAISGNRYRGINMFSLLSKDREDPRWLTFNQASSLGLKVGRGEKASLVQYVKINELQTQKDERGNPLLDKMGKPLKVEIPLSRPLISNAWVFNAAQIEGIQPLHSTTKTEQQWTPHQRAESLIVATGADIVHRTGDRAFYSLTDDRITMPMRAQFQHADAYYSTLLHEMGHWTGHRDRLDRRLINAFGSQEYAREELRAEIASMLVGQELGIGHDPNKHASYVQSWITLLRTTPLEIQSAAADAERIFRYLLDHERKREISTNLQTTETPTVSSLDPKKDALVIGEQINYNNVDYKVLGHLKRGRVRIEDMGSGNVIAVSKNDGLYRSLLAARLGIGASSEIQKNEAVAIAQQQPEREHRKIGR